MKISLALLVTLAVISLFSLGEMPSLLAQREEKRLKPTLSKPAEKKEPAKTTPLPAPQKPIQKEIFPLRSREIRGVDFIGTSQLRSREITGVDFFGTPTGPRSREIVGVDFVGTPTGPRSREISGIDFVGTSTGPRSREITGVDFVGTPTGPQSREITGVDFVGTPVGER